MGGRGRRTAPLPDPSMAYRQSQIGVGAASSIAGHCGAAAAAGTQGCRSASSSNCTGSSRNWPLGERRARRAACQPGRGNYRCITCHRSATAAWSSCPVLKSGACRWVGGHTKQTLASTDGRGAGAILPPLTWLWRQGSRERAVAQARTCRERRAAPQCPPLQYSQVGAC